MPFIAGFLIPFGLLLKTALTHLTEGMTADFFKAARNSLVLSGLASAVAVFLALFFGYALRMGQGTVTAVATRMASLGYALPGTVLAVGILGPLRRQITLSMPGCVQASAFLPDCCCRVLCLR